MLGSCEVSALSNGMISAIDHGSDGRQCEQGSEIDCVVESETTPSGCGGHSQGDGPDDPRRSLCCESIIHIMRDARPTSARIYLLYRLLSLILRISPPVSRSATSTSSGLLNGSR
jgi:hypothetical protein